MTITKEEVQKLLDEAICAPWECDPDPREGYEWNIHIVDFDNNRVCFMAHNGGNKPEWNEARAALIAAAPEIATFALAESARADQAEARLDRHLSIFADHAAVVWGIIRAAGDLPTLNDGPFKDGFITGMEEVAARGDIQAADGNHQLQELCEQIIALVTGEATLIMAKPEVVVQKMAAEAERDTLAAANAALEAKVAGLMEVVIRVKPLDWQEGRFCGQDMFYAETPSGTWMVVCYSGRGFRWAVCDSQGNNSDEDWSTPELAKAAAQGDYNAEVRAALDLTTGPEQTSGWQPIETAPKDGLIDIWLSEGQRWCDCYYDRICDEWRTSRPSGKLVWIKAKHVTHWRPRTPAPAALASGKPGEAGNG